MNNTKYLSEFYCNMCHFSLAEIDIQSFCSLSFYISIIKRKEKENQIYTINVWIHNWATTCTWRREKKKRKKKPL